MNVMIQFVLDQDEEILQVGFITYNKIDIIQTTRVGFELVVKGEIRIVAGAVVVPTFQKPFGVLADYLEFSKTFANFVQFFCALIDMWKREVSLFPIKNPILNIV